MEDVLKFILSSIVVDAGAVSVQSEESEGNVTFTVSVAEDDIGKVIGKEGRTIKAIRTILRTHPDAIGKRITIDIADKKA